MATFSAILVVTRRKLPRQRSRVTEIATLRILAYGVSVSDAGGKEVKRHYPMPVASFLSAGGRGSRHGLALRVIGLFAARARGWTTTAPYDAVSPDESSLPRQYIFVRPSRHAAGQGGQPGRDYDRARRDGTSVPFIRPAGIWDAADDYGSGTGSVIRLDAGGHPENPAGRELCRAVKPDSNR